MIEQLGKIPHKLFKNTQCDKKYFILTFYNDWFSGVNVGRSFVGQMMSCGSNR